jgi:ribosome-associated heat shock protein Hsp15
VRLNGEDPKPGKALKGGDLIQIRVQPIWRSYKVKGFPKSRVGAKLVAEYMQETTDENDLAELEMVRKLNSENRNVGIYGRPTKKHRRDLDDYLEP